jgi:hypothetical protein
VTEGYPYELRLPEAPYRFEWQGEAAVDARKHATDLYAEERYTHADGTITVIREYRSDGTFHIMSAMKMGIRCKSVSAKRAGSIPGSRAGGRGQRFT